MKDLKILYTSGEFEGALKVLEREANKELDAKKLDKVVFEKLKNSAAVQDAFIIIAPPKEISKSYSGKEPFVQTVVPLVKNNYWDAELNKVLKNPRCHVLTVLRTDDGGDVIKEDTSSFIEALKNEIRKFRRNSIEPTDSEESETQSKPTNWKCTVAESAKTSFFSLFMDPSMASLCRDLKYTLRQLEKDCEALEDHAKSQEDSATKEQVEIYSTLESQRDSTKLPFVPFKPPAILLLGETGTGKSLIAEWIASESLPSENDPEKQLNSLNIGAVKSDMIYSELFGATKGSYTDAVSDRHGIFSKSIGKAVFLDEIGEMAPVCQTNLLKYLDNSEVRPMGWAGTPFYFPTLVIAATNRPVDKWVISGKESFREDLLYRFKYIIHIPPLRERKKDMRFLISVTMQDESINPIENGCRRVERISLDAVNYLENLEYPGNFRDFQNKLRTGVYHACLEGAKTLCLRHLL